MFRKVDVKVYHVILELTFLIEACRRSVILPQCQFFFGILRDHYFFSIQIETGSGRSGPRGHPYLELSLQTSRKKVFCATTVKRILIYFAFEHFYPSILYKKFVRWRCQKLNRQERPGFKKHLLGNKFLPQVQTFQMFCVFAWEIPFNSKLDVKIAPPLQK